MTIINTILRGMFYSVVRKVLARVALVVAPIISGLLLSSL